MSTGKSSENSVAGIYLENTSGWLPCGLGVVQQFKVVKSLVQLIQQTLRILFRNELGVRALISQCQQIDWGHMLGI